MMTRSKAKSPKVKPAQLKDDDSQRPTHRVPTHGSQEEDASSETKGKGKGKNAEARLQAKAAADRQAKLLKDQEDLEALQAQEDQDALYVLGPAVYDPRGWFGLSLFENWPEGAKEWAEWTKYVPTGAEWDEIYAVIEL